MSTGLSGGYPFTPRLITVLHRTENPHSFLDSCRIAARATKMIRSFQCLARLRFITRTNPTGMNPREHFVARFSFGMETGPSAATHPDGHPTAWPGGP